MITSVNRSLAEQIVNTIKDVCNHDINFIDCSGIILASTNPARIGTFHEIGLKAAQTGTSIEVTEDDSFSGTQKGINMPLYHEGRILAVIGITGVPDQIRKYAYLAERITNLLIREQELNQYSRREADKKHFVLQSLIQNDTSNRDYLSNSLENFHIGLNQSYRLILIRINSRYNLTNLSLIEQKTQEMFALAGISLFTFFYPRDFVALINTETYQKQAFIFHTFANENASILQVAVGKSTPVFQVHHSYESALTAINTLTNASENFALFDDLTLQLILSSVTDDTRNHFLQKTISGLSTQDLDIIKVYFSEDMSLIRTCDKLYLHKNTLQYKLNRIHKITGLNPRKFQDAVLLYLAVQLRMDEKLEAGVRYASIRFTN